MNNQPKPRLEQWQLRLKFPSRTVNALTASALNRREKALAKELERLWVQALGYRPRWLALKVLTLLREKGWRRGR